MRLAHAYRGDGRTRRSRRFRHRIEWLREAVIARANRNLHTGQPDRPIRVSWQFYHDAQELLVPEFMWVYTPLNCPNFCLHGIPVAPRSELRRQQALNMPV